MPDLSVDFLGIEFPNPIVVTSCSLTRSLDGMLDLAEAGAGGIVTKTISAELLPPQETRYLERDGMQFVPSDQRMLLADALEILPEVKRRTNIPVIANLIGYSNDVEIWTELAQRIERTGVDAVEIDLNAHTTKDQAVPGAPENAWFQPPSIGCDPDLTRPVVEAVKAAVEIPVITKISPLTADLIGIGKASVAAGSDALSLLNAVAGIPGLDIRNEGRPLYEDMQTQGLSATVGLSVGPFATWHTATFGKVFPDTPMLSGGGVMRGEHAIERILLGASLVGVCAVLYRDGNGAIAQALETIRGYLDEFGYENTEAFRGKGLRFFEASDFWAYSGHP